MLVDGFEDINVVDKGKDEESLEWKYGHFAHVSWEDRDLCLRKMDEVKSDL